MVGIVKLEKGDVILVSEKGLLHLPNKLLGWNRFHHTMLYVGDGKVLESTPKKGSHLQKFDIGNGSYESVKVVRRKGLSSKERGRVADIAVRLFNGKKFDWLFIVKVPLRAFIGGKHNAGCKRLACSGIIAAAFAASGHPVTKYGLDYVAPGDYEKSEEFYVVLEKRE